MRYSIIYFIVLTVLASCHATRVPAQPPITRSNSSVTAVDARSKTSLTFAIPVANDTTLNGGLDSLYSLLGVRSGVKQGLWFRDSVSGGGHKWNYLLSNTDAPNLQYWQLSSNNLFPKSNSYSVGIGGSPSFQFDVQNATTGRLYFDGTRMVVSDASSRDNIFVGRSTGQSIGSGANNVGISNNALRTATGGSNIAIGNASLGVVQGSGNTGLGFATLSTTDSSFNTAIGHTAGISNYGKQNTSLGAASGNFLELATATLNNSEISIGTAAWTGTSVGTFISTNSLTTGQKYPFKITFDGTPPTPYNPTAAIFVQGTITNSNTITLNSVAFTGQGVGTSTIHLYNKQDNAIAIGYNVQSTASNEIAIGNSSNDILRMNEFIVDLTTTPNTNDVLTWDGTKYSPVAGGGGGGGSVTSVSGTLPVTVTDPLTTPSIAINNATTSTVGVASFNASDFNVTTGAVTIDYPNGQSASGSTKGFLSATDWNTFNGKQDAITGALTPYLTSNATASRAVGTDGSGKLTTLATTTTEIGYVSGVSSSIQTQLNARVSTTLNSGQVGIGSAGNVYTARTISGDATLSNTGVLTLSTLLTAGSCSDCILTYDAKGRILTAADGSGGGGSPGTVTLVTATSPISITSTPTTTPNVIIQTALADGSTAGAAWFSTNDFNSGGGGISFDYTNAQKATTLVPGLMTSTQVTTLNSAVQNTRTITAGTGLTGGGDLSANRTITLNSIAGFISAGTNVTITGSGTIASPYSISASGGGGGSGTVTNFIFTNGGGFTGTVGTSTTIPTLSVTLQDAAANGSTKGQATFLGTDFNATTGLISIDYTNAQSATGSVKGFLTSTDWTTFNNKQQAATGWVTPVMNALLTANRVAISNGSGLAAASTVTTTELGFLSGATSNIQAQINALGGAPIPKAFQTLTLNGSNQINWVYTSGYNSIYTLTATRTIVISGDVDGDYGTLIINQNGTGGWDLNVPNTDYLQDGINVVGFPFRIDLPDAANSRAVVSWVNHSGVRYWTFGYYHQ